MSYYAIIVNDELYHHGIKGQKWGIRRYQNEDGSLTPEGMKRYEVDSNGNMTKEGMIRRYRDSKKAMRKSTSFGERIKDDFKNYKNLRNIDTNDERIKKEFGDDKNYEEARNLGKIADSRRMKNAGLIMIGSGALTRIGAQSLGSIAKEKSNSGMLHAAKALDSIGDSVFTTGITSGLFGAIGEYRHNNYYRSIYDN